MPELVEGRRQNSWYKKMIFSTPLVIPKESKLLKNQHENFSPSMLSTGEITDLEI